MVSVDALVLRRTALVVPRRTFFRDGRHRLDAELAVGQLRGLRSVDDKSVEDPGVVKSRTGHVQRTFESSARAQADSADRRRVQGAPAAVRLLVTGGTLTELRAGSWADRGRRSVKDGTAHATDALKCLVAGRHALSQSGGPAALVPAALATRRFQTLVAALVLVAARWALLRRHRYHQERRAVLDVAPDAVPFVDRQRV